MFQFELTSFNLVLKINKRKASAVALTNTY